MRHEGLRERGVDASVHDPERLQVAVVHIDPAMRPLVLECHEFEAEGGV
jgi:hypothetical protein